MKYPNLELLDFQAKLHLGHLLRVKDKPTRQSYDFQVQLFPQEWGSTVTGFDMTPENEYTFGGSAMTLAYTTVFWEPRVNAYLVFFDGSLCYAVTEPSEKFYKDLKEQRLAPLSEAKRLY